jgi:hypothetical protein
MQKTSLCVRSDKDKFFTITSEINSSNLSIPLYLPFSPSSTYYIFPKTSLYVLSSLVTEFYTSLSYQPLPSSFRLHPFPKIYVRSDREFLQATLISLLTNLQPYFFQDFFYLRQ